ncbi:MAG: ABC transporter permease, partial [Gemmatimonadetes bacterium]|nr:ABC transporter permease [Gemmatimonadota bacterium]
FDPRGVLTVDLLAPEAGTGDAERDQFLQSVVEQTRALPGVTEAGLINRVPARDGGWQATVAVADRPDLDGDRRPNAFYRPVTPQTFAALGAKIVAGRGILPSDRDDTPRVAVVNESFARRFWGNQDPIGRTITRNGFGRDPIQVVGVVHDMAVSKLVGPQPLAVYYPWAQTMQGSAYGILVVKTTLDPSALAGSVRAVVSSVDPRLAIGRVETMDDVLDGAMAEPLRLRFFLGLFSILGLIMGTVGVYGIVSYGVRRRRSELGIRVALGARPRRLVGEIVGAGMVPVLLGVAAGSFLSWLGSSLLGRFLFGVAPTDAASFAAAASLLVLAGVVAALVPAWRAGGTDPASVLRAE